MSPQRERIDGRPIGKVDFVLSDSKRQLWITASNRVNRWNRASTKRVRDPFMAVLDAHGRRVVAEAERGVSPTPHEVCGPADLGGPPDGIAFDAFGNLWHRAGPASPAAVPV